MQNIDEKAAALCNKLNIPADSPALTAIRLALKEQDRDTRNACAEAILALPCEQGPGQAYIRKDLALSACANAPGSLETPPPPRLADPPAKPTGKPGGKIEIFCDGACSGNPGPGGWGTVIRNNGKEYELSGYNPSTTNNQMELTAAIAGLLIIPEKSKVVITTDSQYVVKGFNEWLPGWIRKGWMTTSGPVKNKELWVKLLDAAKGHEVSFVWVKGHAGHPENERCDQMAVEAIQNKRGRVGEVGQ